MEGLRSSVITVMKKSHRFLELKMMPLNTSLLPPPVEADFNALFAFDDKELIIDPDEEMVSGELSFSNFF